MPKLRARALSPWAVLGMVLIALPLTASVLVAQALFSRDVVMAYDDAATRFEEHVVPTHQLEVALWEGQTRADQYLNTRSDEQLQAYGRARALIRAKFASLKHYAQTETERDSLERARAAWGRADDMVEGRLATVAPGVSKSPETRDQATTEAVNDLREIEAGLALDMRARHVAIEHAHARSKTITTAATAASALVLITSLVLMWRSRRLIGRVARVLKRQSGRPSDAGEPAPLKIA
jgi:hypothetical protein